MHKSKLGFIFTGASLYYTHIMIKFLWDVIKPYKYFYLVMAMAPLCTSIYPIIYNYAVKLLIDMFVQSNYITFSQAFKPILWFILGQIIIDSGWRLHNFAQLKTIPYVFQRMMHKICQHVFYLPYTYFQNNLSGSITAKMRGIGDNYYKMHQALEWKLSKPLLITIFSGIVLVCINFKIFFFILGFQLLFIPCGFIFFTKLAKMEQGRQDSWYYLFGTIADRVQNVFNIFSFATRKKEIESVQNYYRNVQNPLTVRYYKYDFIIGIFFSLIYWAFIISLFIFVIYLKNAGEVTIGDIAFVISLMFLFTENSWHATLGIKDFLSDLAAFKSAFSIMKVAKCTIDKENAKDLKISKGEITFKDISFSYEKGGKIFDNFNLHIKPSQKVGLVGHSGTGKSTLVSLILKNFKATEGDITIDNQSIYDVSSDSLRSHISLIPQDIMLFHRSIGENIGYAKENVTQAEIEQAAKMANIHEFILSLPDGYNTLVGERGIKLSGGQRQRIAIARAILKNAPLLILDEATSSLDSETENEVQKSINTMLEKNKATVIAIAHRLSTIKHMDRIIVMEEGKIVEDGTFKTLLEKPKGKFKELWDHQVNGMLV